MIKWFERHNNVCWLLTLFIAIIIFYISSLTFEPSAGGFSINSYLYHFLAFLFFAGFLLISLLKGRLNKKLFLIAIIIAVLYGISDEVHQLYVPGRHFAIIDIITNSIGILTASIVYFVLLIKKR